MHPTEQIYRGACRRSHRILGHYLAFWAWKKRVDCVCLDRNQLLTYLGLDAMRQQRLDWLAEDIKRIFPYSESLYFSNSKYFGIFLSRRRFPIDAFEDSMDDQERIKLLNNAGLKTAKPSRLPSERAMTAVLAGAATGG